MPDSPMRAYFDHAAEALFVHDETGRVIEVNRQACESLGYTRDELVGMPVTGFDPSLTLDEVARIGRRLAGGDGFTIESVHQRKDGSRFPVEVRLRPIRDGERRLGLALVRDITERKRLEETQDTLAQGLAMIVMQLSDAEAKLGPLWARAEKPLTTVRELAAEGLAQARRSVSMLRNGSSAASLTRAVQDVVEDARRAFDGTIALGVSGRAVVVPLLVESALIGIAREALSNAARHGGADRIRVELDFAAGGGVRLVVADEGVGFDSTEAGPECYGLLGMQERAGRAGIALTIVTEPGAGTEIVSSWSPRDEPETRDRSR